MKANVHLFGGANDSHNRTSAERAAGVKFASLESIRRLFGAINKSTHENKFDRYATSAAC
jgi:hypothetical protein